jgi:hypothetical protein
MSADDDVFLKELFAPENACPSSELIRTHQAIWERWKEAFDQAVREVPPPYVMSVYDRWM